MSQFIFVRHGQTEWNRDNRFRGRADIPLNATGVEQAQRVAGRLANEKIAMVYASPLSRTMRTAEMIAQPHALPVNPRSELLDFDYGDWQGKLVSEVDAAQYALWRTEPDRVMIPGGETLSALHSRVIRLIELLSQQHGGETVLLVSHDIVAKVVLCALSGAENNSIHRWQQDNACINRFDTDDGKYLIRTVNDTAHLL